MTKNVSHAHKGVSYSSVTFKNATSPVDFDMIPRENDMQLLFKQLQKKHRAAVKWEKEECERFHFCTGCPKEKDLKMFGQINFIV